MPRRWTLRIHGARTTWGSKLSPLSGHRFAYMYICSDEHCSPERGTKPAVSLSLVALRFARMPVAMNYSPNVTAASEYFQRRYITDYI